MVAAPSSLSHNVVETVDLVQDEQQHWCEVMEYCPGGDLYAVIKKGDLGPAEINSYFKQILSGVAYLHSMGVAHRDIKPENLLLDAKGHVKITDFGVSDVFRMCWERTTHLSKGLCGSEPYIAPEQFEQKGACFSLSLSLATFSSRLRVAFVLTCPASAPPCRVRRPPRRRLGRRHRLLLLHLRRAPLASRQARRHVVWPLCPDLPLVVVDAAPAEQHRPARVQERHPEDAQPGSQRTRHYRRGAR